MKRVGCDLPNHCVRTWFFVQNVDVNYHGVVVGRRENFMRIGLNEHTHYIASTGIEGRSADPKAYVGMDAYAVAELQPGQQQYLYAHTHLNPTSEYVEGLQMYHYRQARVLRYGLEAQASYAFTRHWEAELKGEYLYAEQLSGEKKGYTLPFSTPWSVDAALKYSFEQALLRPPQLLPPHRRARTGPQLLADGGAGVLEPLPGPPPEGRETRNHFL